ncbi:cupin domain-containing protein [Kitasatospora aureofaciens]|uniref:Cupin n=1 Tax=Kitasatospora aureofaciens TaxID=1894 RepID=A0A1E7N7H6_KITAU|nr:cupin domain-containing protein [Kitasatospora aureofaciens]OEV36640.1 cupin [Kitasatospora aureofaciens]QEV02920.1 cupin domain-containing protein [Streptomyces viridifaciens]UKZ09540.1 cupin domain-containing protein [Streptomyces viridifaciens]GGU57576.1 cupin [Kitasatospora aureofaciens]
MTGPLTPLADAPTFERDGFTFRPLAVPSRGSTELAIWALELAPGVHSETHSMDREEVFVVIEGKVSATVAGEDVLAEAGDAIIVPAHSTLQLRNGCPHDPAKLTAVTSAGMKATVGGVTFAPPWAQ